MCKVVTYYTSCDRYYRPAPFRPHPFRLILLHEMALPLMLFREHPPRLMLLDHAPEVIKTGEQ